MNVSASVRASIEYVRACVRESGEDIKKNQTVVHKKKSEAVAEKKK
jgi:hypothetical protein